MIPLKITIKNFLSYGPTTQVIDFAHHQLICLSGKNGHGKSALLDAITWVLWGQARKTGSTSKADEGLVHLGQTDMMVSIDVQINDTVYRIRRECIRYTKRSKITLDIGIVNQKSNETKPLSENQIRCTQEQINTIIGLDYHTFTNSVFLRQGHANEFSKKTAKERKKILATILGLDHYDRLQKKALEQNRKLQQKHTVIEKIIEHLLPDVNSRNSITQEIQELKKQDLQIQQEENTLLQKKLALAQEKNHLVEKKQQCIQAEQRQNQIQSDIQEKKEHLKSTYKQWRTIQKEYVQEQQKIKIQKKEEITQAIAYQEREKSRFNKLHEIILKTKEELYHQHKTIEEAYTQKTQQTTQQRYELESTIKNSTENVEQKTQELQLLKQQNNKVASQYKQLLEKNKQYRTIEILEHKLARYTSYIQKSSAEQATRTMRIKAITYDVNRICASSKAVCPVCDQNLHQQKKDLLIADYTRKRSLAMHQVKRLKKIHVQVETLIKTCEQEKALQQDIALKIKQLQEKSKLLEKEFAQKEAAQKLLLSKLQQAHKDLLTCMQTQEKHEKQKVALFESNKIYQQLKKLLKQKQSELSACSYNHETYLMLQKQLATVVEHERKNQEKARSYALQNERKKRIRELCAQMRLLKKESYQYGTLSALKKAYDQKYAKLETQEKIIAEKQRDLMQQKLSLMQKQGALEQQKIRCDKALKEYDQHKSEQKELEQNIRTMTILAHALSKDGIQALVIENAIPEIEQEANALLSRLTQNQTHIIIDSTRDLKSGGTRETLDIKISDPAGIRPYEMFSGGEAFRIDFALRIALSKLLARRAGTTLQTLIIDEGFSSQDEDGLNHIVNTLNAIQQDFAKIIIVSHLAQLKEQFPVHFHVHKNIDGSSIRLLAN